VRTWLLVHSTISPVATGALVGLAPPKFKSETLWVSGIFVKFSCQASHARTYSPPIDDFLTMVLSTIAFQCLMGKFF